MQKIGERSSTPHSVKVAIAYALGSSGHTDEAVQVVEGMKGDYAGKYQCEGYSWLAVAVAPREKARAAALIDRALAIPLDQPRAFQSWTYFGGGAGAAAWAAACARRAGYADMGGAVMRVLASRASDRHSDPSMEAQSQTVAAAILALSDPKAASQMLRDLELRSGVRRDGLARMAGRNWFLAWALADPSYAERLFDAELAALEGQPDVNLRTTGVLKIAEVLVQPPNRREEFLRRELGATWYPGSDR